MGGETTSDAPFVDARRQIARGTILISVFNSTQGFFGAEIPNIPTLRLPLRRQAPWLKCELICPILDQRPLPLSNARLVDFLEREIKLTFPEWSQLLINQFVVTGLPAIRKQLEKFIRRVPPPPPPPPPDQCCV